MCQRFNIRAFVERDLEVNGAQEWEDHILAAQSIRLEIHAHLGCRHMPQFQETCVRTEGKGGVEDGKITRSL